MGPKRVYRLTLMLMVVCSIASGLSFGKHAGVVMTTLCFFRFWLGFGIGGFRILAGGIVAIIVSSAFNHAFPAPAYKDSPETSTVPQADYVWRIILMFGSVLAALTYYWRMKMPETEGDKVAKMAKSQGDSYGLFSKEFLGRHGFHLVGTTTTWFLLDVAFNSQNLFQKDIFIAIGWLPHGKEMKAIDEVFRIAKAQTLIALCRTVPGYWFMVALIDIMGKFTIQLSGFFFMTVLTICTKVWTKILGLNIKM
ncbi:hypothetical protein SLEP1_g29345 [Rubroshorea leprosula]|uniref:Uncharacterized protein n=1 Tax=Rubroshorea leprosula TaxID=152421 RepID=A0AAV5K6T4_9ROSI|nr:hypothetical protein SLEP1_g29345 [Rubroshorea leprosula]